MMPFSTGTGLERVGVVEPDLDCWRAGLQAPGSSGLLGTGLERVGVVGPDLDCWRAGLQAPGSSGLLGWCAGSGCSSPLQK